MGGLNDDWHQGGDGATKAGTWNDAIEAAAKVAERFEKLGSESATVIAMEIRALAIHENT